MQTVVDYFSKQGTPLDKIIERRPAHLSPDQVRAGAILLFERIQSGEEIKQINLARAVWEMSKSAKNESHAREQIYIKRGVEHIKALEDEVVSLKQKNEDDKAFLQNTIKTERKAFLWTSGVGIFFYAIYRLLPLIDELGRRYLL